MGESESSPFGTDTEGETGRLRCDRCSRPRTCRENYRCLFPPGIEDVCFFKSVPLIFCWSGHRVWHPKGAKNILLWLEVPHTTNLAPHPQFTPQQCVSPHLGPRDQWLPPTIACKRRRSPYPQQHVVVSRGFRTTTTEKAASGISSADITVSSQTGLTVRTTTADSSRMPRCWKIGCSRGNTLNAGCYSMAGQLTSVTQFARVFLLRRCSTQARWSP